MLIIPAIDLMDGKPVRLYQGDYSKKEQVAADALQQAQAFEKAGARFLHLVDLDGARSGKTDNRQVILDIADTLSIPVEVGGGIRSMQDIEDYLEHGVHRIILGTAAIENPQLLKEAASRYGERIVLGLDVRDEKIQTRGWLQDSGLPLFEYLKAAEDLGLSHIIVTDIATDGTLNGPNLELMEKIVHNSPFQLVASGGIGSLEDLRKLNEVGPDAVIVGKALYNGAVDLQEALALAG